MFKREALAANAVTLGAVGTDRLGQPARAIRHRLLIVGADLVEHLFTSEAGIDLLSGCIHAVPNAAWEFQYLMNNAAGLHRCSSGTG